MHCVLCLQESGVLSIAYLAVTYCLLISALNSKFLHSAAVLKQ